MRTALLPLLAAACALTEDTFPERFATDWCARAKSCDEDAYFDRWIEGTITCKATTAEEVAQLAYGNGSVSCRFQEELAQDCLQEVAAATCAQVGSTSWVEGCTAAWDCIAILTP